MRRRRRRRRTFMDTKKSLNVGQQVQVVHEVQVCMRSCKCRRCMRSCRCRRCMRASGMYW